jgi:hypothetical protein
MQPTPLKRSGLAPYDQFPWIQTHPAVADLRPSCSGTSSPFLIGAIHTALVGVGTDSGLGPFGEPPRGAGSTPGHRRRRPVFSWRHRWGSGDGLAAILIVGGSCRVILAVAHSQYVRGCEWLGAPAAGFALFALLSLISDD